MKLNGVDVGAYSGNIAKFLESQSIRPRGIAVSVDGEIVPRSMWSTRMLDGSECVEVVTAAAGG